MGQIRDPKNVHEEIMNLVLREQYRESPDQEDTEQTIEETTTASYFAK